MNEDCFRRRIANNFEEMGQLCVGWICEAANGNPQEFYAEGFSAHTLLLRRAGRFRAEINDGGDPEFFQFVQLIQVRLCATIKMLSDLSGVVYTGHGDIFCDFECGKIRLARRKREQEAQEESQREAKKKFEKKNA